MVTRREELARIAEGSGTPGGKEAGPEREHSAPEGDFLGGFLQGTVEPPKSANEDPIPTRVKPPADKASAKPLKGKVTPGRTASERELEAVGDQLEEKIATIFGMASGLAPVTSVYAVENSPKAIHALLEIAKRRPAVLKALTQVADGANALEIGKFVLGVLVCIQVDAGRLEGTEIQARAFGVTDVLDKHFANPDHPDNQKVNPNVTVMEVPDALRFQPIP